ncbi:hypothetical protein EDB83DRAFT_2323984 [Lactarius deliciosus]|nr:hypothetical protein EDB83DRAFT_2323984 [Lactarius deliciosus]
MSQMLCAFQFIKKSLLELHPGLEEVSEDAAMAEEWIQNFSIFLEFVYSSRAGADLATEEDTKVSNFLEETNYWFVVGDPIPSISWELYGSIPILLTCLSAGTPPSKQVGVKHSHPSELINVHTLDDYIWCEPCISSKTKCTPLVGTWPPYPCARCVKTGRECVCDPATCSWHNRSAMPSLGLPLALEEPSASAFFGIGKELSSVALASVVTHWQAASGKPPAKWVCSLSLKEKVVDVDAPMKTHASLRGKVKVDVGTHMETHASSKRKERAHMDVEDGTVMEVEDGAEVENWEGFT